jgi:cytochrome c556
LILFCFKRNHKRQQQERTTLIEIVQEAAKYAEKISEILKTPTAFDATLFKENLTAMVNAVKRIDPYIADENQRQKVITTTRTVLERAIEFHQSGGQSSPLPLLNSVTELLRCLTVGLQQ